MATHSSVLAWRIPGTAERGGLPSVGSQSRTRLKRLSSSSRDQIAGLRCGQTMLHVRLYGRPSQEGQGGPS